MRNAPSKQYSKYKILVVDDEPGVIESLNVVLGRSGYNVYGETNPLEAVARIRNESFDMLILDFLMSPIHGDKVVELVRQFNKELYILMLTGYKDLAPPMETIRSLDIQGYCEKSNRFDQLILLVEGGLKHVSQMETIYSYRDGLQKILSVTPKIFRNRHIGPDIQNILENAVQILNIEDSFLLLDPLSPRNADGTVFYGTGIYRDKPFYQDVIKTQILENIAKVRGQEKVLRINEGILFPLRTDGDVFTGQHGKPQNTNPQYDAPDNGSRENDLPENDNRQNAKLENANPQSSTRSKRDIGVIFIACDHEDNVKSGLVEIFASQAAAAIENAYLHAALREKSDEINNAYAQLHERYLSMVEALQTIMNTKDAYTSGHSDRVCYYALKIGESLHLDANALETLNIGSKFHDIGKIGTADSILLKKGHLTDEEFNQIKKHTRAGEQILAVVNMFQDILPLVRNHHERVDGSGYPDGLFGDNIPLLARIIAVADAFDAMTSDRPYRERLSTDYALAELRRCSGSQFDPIIIAEFTQLIENNTIQI